MELQDKETILNLWDGGFKDALREISETHGGDSKAQTEGIVRQPMITTQKTGGWYGPPNKDGIDTLFMSYLGSLDIVFIRLCVQDGDQLHPIDTTEFVIYRDRGKEKFEHVMKLVWQEIMDFLVNSGINPRANSTRDLTFETMKYHMDSQDRRKYQFVFSQQGMRMRSQTEVEENRDYLVRLRREHEIKQLLAGPPGVFAHNTHLDHLAEKWQRIQDSDHAGIDVDIVSLLDLINDTQGFQTLWSCSGHIEPRQKNGYIVLIIGGDAPEEKMKMFLTWIHDVQLSLFVDYGDNYDDLQEVHKAFRWEEKFGQVHDPDLGEEILMKRFIVKWTFRDDDLAERDLIIRTMIDQWPSDCLSSD